jgi:hypothetical protein
MPNIAGIVTAADTGQPITGAVVIVTGPAMPGESSEVTDATGFYEIFDLPVGVFTLRVQADLYRAYVRSDIELRGGIGTKRENVKLEPEKPGTT